MADFGHDVREGRGVCGVDWEKPRFGVVGFPAAVAKALWTPRGTPWTAAPLKERGHLV